MVTSRAICSLAVGLAVAVVSAAYSAGFTVISSNGDVQVGGEGRALVPAKAGDACQSGTLIQTGKDGRMAAQLDASNGFSVQAQTTLRVEDVTIAKTGVRLTLEAGRVESNLEAWPASTAYDVQTLAGAVSVHGSSKFVSGYRLGTTGEYVGDVDVSVGEIEYRSPECSVPSVTANGGLTVVRTVAPESVLLEMTVRGNDVTAVIGGKARLSVTAGTTVRIAMAVRHASRSVAIWVQDGSVKVGDRTITSVDQAVFVAGTTVLAKASAVAFMAAVRAEASAHAQAQLPGLAADQVAKLQAAEQSGAQAVADTAAAGAVAPAADQAAFVPPRPLTAPFTPRGRP